MWIQAKDATWVRSGIRMNVITDRDMVLIRSVWNTDAVVASVWVWTTLLNKKEDVFLREAVFVGVTIVSCYFSSSKKKTCCWILLALMRVRLLLQKYQQPSLFEFSALPGKMYLSSLFIICHSLHFIPFYWWRNKMMSEINGGIFAGCTGMTPPIIHGEPRIVQNTKTNTVCLEVIVSGWCHFSVRFFGLNILFSSFLCFLVGILPEKTKWFLGEREIEPTETYVFSQHDEGGKRTLLRCEIKVNKSFVWFHAWNRDSGT